MILAAQQEGLEHLEAHRVVVHGKDPHADGEVGNWSLPLATTPVLSSGLMQASKRASPT